MNKKIVLTGGPGAGKTTIAEVLDKAFPQKLIIVPEAASILFNGGFPRWDDLEIKKSIQKAVYYVQIELEKTYELHYPNKLLVLDRSTLDGAAYWPDHPNNFFKEFNSSL